MGSAVDIARQMSRIESRLADEPDNGKLHAQRRIAERQLELRLELEAYSRPGARIRPPIYPIPSRVVSRRCLSRLRRHLGCLRPWGTVVCGRGSMLERCSLFIGVELAEIARIRALGQPDSFRDDDSIRRARASVPTP